MSIEIIAFYCGAETVLSCIALFLLYQIIVVIKNVVTDLLADDRETDALLREAVNTPKDKRDGGSGAARQRLRRKRAISQSTRIRR